VRLVPSCRHRHQLRQDRGRSCSPPPC
jgi:hypothetical protein